MVSFICFEWDPPTVPFIHAINYYIPNWTLDVPLVKGHSLFFLPKFFILLNALLFFLLSYLNLSFFSPTNQYKPKTGIEKG